MAGRELPLLRVLLIAGVLAGVAGRAQGARPRGLSSSSSAPGCQPALIVFGASFSDTGENAEAMPMRSAAEFEPYGVDYFRKPVGRWSNGRVITDFIAHGLGHPFLDPYLRSVEGNFRHGVNFASSGSTAKNSTVSGNGTDSSGLFSLSVQIDQFRKFKASVLLAQAHNHDSLQHLPTAKGFAQAIYYMQTGQNDYISTAFTTSNYDPLTAVLATIPAIEQGIRELHKLGAKNIVVMNIIPLGCTPAFLSTQTTPKQLDTDGCLANYNELVDLHNTHLQSLIAKLRIMLHLKGLVVFDANGIYLDAVRNPSKYGVVFPFKACCGAGGGEFNILRAVSCGKSGVVNGTLYQAKRCDEPSQYISWDGLHPVESFARHIANGVLTGEYLKPSFSINDACMT